jgi:hypothetical protein
VSVYTVVTVFVNYKTKQTTQCSHNASGRELFVLFILQLQSEITYMMIRY